MADTKEIIDVNLTEQAGTATTATEAPTTEAPVTEAPVTDTADDTEVVEDTTAETDVTTVTEAPTAEDADEVEETYDVAAAYRKATGLVGIDVTELAKTATTPILKMTLFNGLMWHLGRITSCDNEDHTAHTGKYNADGTDSKLVKALKGLFGID